MIIQQDDSNSVYVIQRYEAGRLWINNKVYEQSIILRGNTLISPWHPGPVENLKPEDFDVFQNDFPNTIIIGTGVNFIIPPMELLRPFLEKGIGVEYMDSKAACYTYIALAAENRDVAVFILR